MTDLGSTSSSSDDAARVIASLRHLADVVRPDHGVDYLAHSLQAAWRAQLDGASDELVVAALCHDLGRLVPTNDHARVAADVLSGHVHPAIVAIVANHSAIGAAAEDFSAWAGRPWLAEATRFVQRWDRPSFGPRDSLLSLEQFTSRLGAILGSSRPAPSTDFDDLLGGMSVATFGRDYFGRRPLVAAHETARSSDRSADEWRWRFDHLFDLSRMESLVLRHHRDRAGLDGAGRPRSRVRIDRADGPVPDELFHQPIELPGGEMNVLAFSAVSILLNEGARVTMFAVDELDEALAHVTAAIALAMGRPASMRAVATWSAAAPDPRPSAHHRFVFHLAGERAWSLKPHALELGGPEPMEQTLEPGDLLYVPARWVAGWQDVRAPALHLVVDVFDDPINDIFERVRPLLVEAPVMREDLPTTATPEERSAYARRLFDALLGVFGRPSG